jgi:phenylpropionate dioxygenase-like ring-hydroxylating dioxygenase large terminal subunit
VYYAITLFAQDPQHVPVSHHKTAGDRNKDPEPIKMTVVRQLTAEGGATISKDAASYVLKVL